MSAIFAVRTRTHPAIVQVNEIGTATMMAAGGAIYPVYQLMKDQGEPFDPKAYLPAVAGYYTDMAGNMLSYPFNSSTPILYYNKQLFKVAGLDENTPLATWPEVEKAARRLRAAGVPCGFTTHWPSWVHVENLSALAQYSPRDTVERNGGARRRTDHQQPFHDAAHRSTCGMAKGQDF